MVDSIQMDLLRKEKSLNIKSEQARKEAKRKATVSGFFNMLGILLLIVLIIYFGYSIVKLQSVVNEAKYNIFNLKQEVISLTEKKEEMQVAVDIKMDLVSIEHMAMETFGMVYPEAMDVTTLRVHSYYTLEEGLRQFTANK